MDSMPNWAEGILKVRGTKKEVMNFLENGLRALDFGHQIVKVLAETSGEKVKQREPNQITFDIDDWETKVSAPEGFHIKGTRRAFIEGDISFYHEEIEDDEKFVLVIDNFKQAWGVDPNDYIQISVDYGIDIRIHAYELGMEFNQHITIENGVITQNEEIQFDDYNWECPHPNLGG